jgi:ABC-2 type transport system permease protein
MVRILSTLLRPDAGTARVGGYDVARDPERVRARIGLTGQSLSVDGKLSGSENLAMFGRLHRLAWPVVRERSARLLDVFDLGGAGRKAVKAYSGGMRRMTIVPAGTSRQSAAWVASDYWEMAKRSLRHIRHDPEQLVNVTLQPVLIVLIADFLLGGAINIGTPGSYINFVMPGILVVAAAFAAVTTTVSVAADMLEGVLDRFRTLPMAKSAVITGHLIADLARSLLGLAVTIGAGYAAGFRPAAGIRGWATAVAVFLLVTLALSLLAALIGLLGKSVEVAQQLGAIIINALPEGYSLRADGRAPAARGRCGTVATLARSSPQWACCRQGERGPVPSVGRLSGSPPQCPRRPWLEKLAIRSRAALCASGRKAYYHRYCSGPRQLHSHGVAHVAVGPGFFNAFIDLRRSDAKGSKDGENRQARMPLLRRSAQQQRRAHALRRGRYR